MKDAAIKRNLEANTMDLQAGWLRLLSMISQLLVGLDKAIEIDNSDDGYWMRTAEQIGLAIDLSDKDSEHVKCLRKALTLLRTGMGIDYGDRSKEEIKALLMPLQAEAERGLASAKKITAKDGAPE